MKRTNYDGPIVRGALAWTAVALVALLGVPHAHSVQGEADLPPGIISKEPAKTFQQRVTKINASPAFFEALSAQPDNGPVINLNLLRYRPRGNSEIYDRYGAVAGPDIVAMGGDIVLHGIADTKMPKIFEMSDAWDGVAFVMYPRRASYIQLQRSEAYQDGIADRVAGTDERMLYVISDGDAIYKPAESIENLHGTKTRIAFETGNVFVVQLLRFKKPDGRERYKQFAVKFGRILEEAGGKVVLSVRAEMPIVSEEYWDHFVTFQFPSADVMKSIYQSDAFHSANIDRTQSLDATLAVMMTPTPLPGK